VKGIRERLLDNACRGRASGVALGCPGSLGEGVARRLTGLTVAAVVFRDDQGRLLTVRKRGTSRFMLPGGKPEPGEDSRTAAAREIGEELGLTIDASELVFLGAWESPAANEPGMTVHCSVYAADLVGVPCAAAEIAELRWTGVTGVHDDVAPLLTDHVLPHLTRSAGPDAEDAC
jgi:8-oxo-dGTP diphosphatase